MKSHVLKALSLVAIFISLSCNQVATPGGAVGGGGNTTADCASQSGTICDLLLPKGTGVGSCRTACDPNNSVCTDGQVCNPISGACELNCATQPSPVSFCQQNLPQGSNATAMCVSYATDPKGNGYGGAGYCTFSTSSACPGGFGVSGDLCKL